MPDRSSTVVSYAAGASLAAVALIYVFGPTFTIDNDASNSKTKTIVGLRNQANDCFINSVLQALAGLGELRVYLIREMHRRSIEDQAVYANLVQPQGSELALWKLQGLQDGLVTSGLKEMLDALNERPIAKKAISPFQFVKTLELAFRQRISRQQQDAQEFLQIVAERLKDEYHAGERARFQARNINLRGATQSDSGILPSADVAHEVAGNVDEPPQAVASDPTEAANISQTTEPTSRGASPITPTIQLPSHMEAGFPMEGKYESHLECQTCHYRTKPREETFCTITLAVPQITSTSLSSCFDGIFKTEYIDDFKCEMCRLVRVKADLEHDLSRSTSETFKEQSTEKIKKLQLAIDTDPENPPEDVDLGDVRYAPKRKISKTTSMSLFPKILAIHLSRSIYDIGQITQKNSAKVSFPEELPLGSLADQRRYKLLGLVTHRGGHNSGHYEAFRRQNLPAPYHNANTFLASEVYSNSSTPISTPEISARRLGSSPTSSTPDLVAASSAHSSPTQSLESMPVPPRATPSESTIREIPGSAAQDKDAETSSLRSRAASAKSAFSRLASPKPGQEPFTTSKSPLSPSLSVNRKALKAQKRMTDKWWRISDEKVREARTSEALGMQKEVYLLFYELEKEV